MHGLHCTAAEFVVTGRSSSLGEKLVLLTIIRKLRTQFTISLAYLLADNGYDVWLANARGTEFSKNHKTLNSNSTPYWNFSYHEMAKYDLPAIVDHILEITNQSALHYVGEKAISFRIERAVLFQTLQNCI